MLSIKNKKILRTELKKYFGTNRLSEIRKVLKSNATEQYGCYFCEMKINNGLSISYTSNENHFSEYTIKINLVGMVHTLALSKKDITKKGILRGCSEYYAL